MKAIRIINTVWATGGTGDARIVFEAGSVQPKSDPRAMHALNYGNGQEVDVEDAPAAPATEPVAEPAATVEAAAPAAPAEEPAAPASTKAKRAA